MNKEKWLQECSEYFVEHAKMSQAEATEMAITIRMNDEDGDWHDDPTGCAAEEMSYWGE